MRMKVILQHIMRRMMDMDNCPMRMYFHWDINDCILFYQWQPKNVWQYTLSLVTIFIMCILREFILYIGNWYEFKTLYPQKFENINKFWVTSYDIKRIEKMQSKVKIIDNNNPINRNDDGSLSPSLSSKSKQMWYSDGYPLYLRIIDGITYGFSLLFSYWLMLIAMTYNGMYFHLFIVLITLRMKLKCFLILILFWDIINWKHLTIASPNFCVISF